MLILGPVGVGKSAILGMLAEAAVRNGIRALYVTVARLCDLMHDDEGKQRLEQYERIRLLLLDDLGAEYGSEYHDARLAALIDARWSARRSTVVTSNLTVERIRSEYPGMERAWDRLFDASRTEVLVIRGRSRRKGGES